VCCKQRCSVLGGCLSCLTQTARTVRKAGEQGESAQEPRRACALLRGAHQLYGLQGRATECSKQSMDATLSRKR